MEDRALLTLKENFPDAIIEVGEFRGETTVSIHRQWNIPVLRFLKNDEELAFNFLSDLTCVDYLKFKDVGLEPRFAVVYHLYSFKNNNRLRVKALVTDEDPSIDSIASLWPSADWLEREVYDLYGITFRGHPDLRRILMPDDYDGFPLRKDYPLRGRGYRESFEVITRERAQ